jgi:hypothetical protein
VSESIIVDNTISLLIERGGRGEGEKRRARGERKRGSSPPSLARRHVLFCDERLNLTASLNALDVMVLDKTDHCIAERRSSYHYV